MDRLTGRDEYGGADIIELPKGLSELFAGISRLEANVLIEVTNHLAAYEDTGITPGEIEQLKADNARLRDSIDEFRRQWSTKLRGIDDERKAY